MWTTYLGVIDRLFIIDTASAEMDLWFGKVVKQILDAL